MTENKKHITYKPNPFKCYINGVYYKTSIGYMKDLERHMINGDWEKAMDITTKEHRTYLYNYHFMNGHFRPYEESKSTVIPSWKNYMVNKMIDKFNKSKLIEVNE